MSKIFEQKLERAKEERVCWVGPFAGEFGHMLIHILPFVSYLYEQNIDIIFCGQDSYECLFVNEEGKSTVKKYYGYPQFLKESTPDGNDAYLIDNAEVYKALEEFKKNALESGDPFFDLSEHWTYKAWFTWWLGKGYGKLYNIGKVYNQKEIKENAIGFFTRTKVHTGVTGPEWDVGSVVTTSLNFCDKIYTLGNIYQSHKIKREGVENYITENNIDIFRAASQCKVIISYNSGTAYVGKILRIPIVIINNGDIRSFHWTDYCSRRWSNSPMHRAINIGELTKLLQEYK